jgi:hypothetical protein
MKRNFFRTCLPLESYRNHARNVRNQTVPLLFFFRRRKITRSEVLGSGIDEIHEAGTAVELGEEDSGMSLSFGALDPLQARSNAAALATSFSQHSATIATHPHLCSTLVKLLLSSSRLFSGCLIISPDAFLLCFGNFEGDGMEWNGMVERGRGKERIYRWLVLGMVGESPVVL